MQEQRVREGRYIFIMIFALLAISVYATYYAFIQDHEKKEMREMATLLCMKEEQEMRNQFYLSIMNDTCVGQDMLDRHYCSLSSNIKKLLKTYLSDLSYCNDKKSFHMGVLLFRISDEFLHRLYKIEKY
jgi:hypothetical protein